MARKLIVCCDGTWNNEDGAGTPTNVAKLHRIIQSNYYDGADQIVYYVAGVGTEMGERIRGGAFGKGLDENIREAYRFLVGHYEEGDQLFFFGFSRGAYTARSLAGFIRNSGLLKPEFVGQLSAAFKLYRGRSDTTHPNSDEATEFRARYSYTPDIEFIGVWDTVGSLGIPVSRLGILSWFGRWVDRRYAFHDTDLSRIVKHAYHAIAVHERRGTFPATLWKKQADVEGQVLEQVWFPGVHCDVGGGYYTTGLSDAAFDWMIEKAKGCGLKFREEALQHGVLLAPDPIGKLHDSYGFFFKLIDWMNGQIGGAPRAFNADTASCEQVSNIAKDRFRSKKDETWPESFLSELRREHTDEGARVRDIHP
ncbi:MAG: DUF2235 domain-containing protein [Rhodospirillales bacterium]|nr:DUF2235 domain-containing protein [Acetobacter sp.]